MATCRIIVLTINLTAVFLLQNLFVLVQMDSIDSESEVMFYSASASVLKVQLQSSESNELVHGGTVIDFELTISYKTGTIFSDVDKERQSDFNDYCNYVERLQKTVLYRGGETFLNCTNITRTVESNYTCNSSDGIHCIDNTTANLQLFSGNWSLLNSSNSSLPQNVTITEIVKKAFQNVTFLHCVNSTTPLIGYKPTIHSPGFFNLTYQTVEMNIDLPSEFNIDAIDSLTLTHDFDNVTQNCTKFVVNSTDTKHASKPSIKVNVQFANISWNGSMVIHATVSERVIPRQSLNVTGNVRFDNKDKELWIGSFTVPGLQFQSLQLVSTNFPETPGTLLTDEEEITVQAKFVVPSVTTNIDVFVQLPVYNGSVPLKINSASVGSMHSNIYSVNLRSGSGIGRNIITSEVISLNPGAPTLVRFKFGRTVTSPSSVEKSVVLSVTGIIDATNRYDVYVPGTFGNISSWLVYSTALGDETIKSPQKIETELGQPQVKYEMSFEKNEGKIEAGLEINSFFKFYNPHFATEGVKVSVDVSLASQHMELINFLVKLCNVSTDTLEDCINTDENILTISNTSNTINIDITNLTAGNGVSGNAVSVILSSVPASEILSNQISLRYERDRWSPVVGNVYLSLKTQSITVSTQVISSSVDSTSEQNAAVGEKFKCRINGAIPLTTNEDFVIVIGSDSSVIYGQAIITHVGENLASDRFSEGTDLNITSGITPYMGSSPVFFGQFGTVRNYGNSVETSASTFTIEVDFFIKDINVNINSKTITLTSKVYHNPSNRNYASYMNFKVVEPVFQATATVSPNKDVKQNTELSFVATIKRASISTSTAFNMMLFLAVPFPHLTLTDFTSQSGTLRTVPGTQSPVQFLSPADINSTVIIYENDAFSQSSSEIKYKARTSLTLPPSIFIISSFIMSYTSLPKNLNQSLARQYLYGPKSEPTLLTFRPEPFLSFSFLSLNDGKFDSGDILNFTLILKNIGVSNVKPIAYSVKISLPLSKTFFKDSSAVCNQGSVRTTGNGDLEIFAIETGTFMFNEEIRCDVKTTLNTVVPSQKIKLTSALTYHCLPVANQNEYEGYSAQDENEILIKELTMQLSATGSTSEVLCGDVLNFTVRISLPEVTTNLRIEYEIPTIASNARGKRSIRKKRASQINILKPDPTETSYTNGGNLIISGMTKSLIDNTYTVEFPTVTNQADNINSENDVLTLQAQFLVENEPVIFSGRSFDIMSTVYYTGGSVSQTAKFSVVGPLVEPFLQLAKSFHVIDPSMDSPSGMFYVNISHTASSQYDAYDVNITDFIEGMNIIRDNDFPGIEISTPTDNTYKLSSNIPVIAVGETVRFYYKSKFKVDVKTPKYIQKFASITWRSPQLNSPSYGPEMNADACVARNDTIKEKHEPLYGFLALGAFLGILIGFLLVLICVCIFIKCCRRGRLVPYYRVLVSKTTYTALEDEESEEKSFTTPANTSVHQTASVVYIICSHDPKRTENELENLDIQATKSLDRQMETSRQVMFVTAFEHILKNLRNKRDISEDQMKVYMKKLQVRLDEISVKNRQEYNRRCTDLQREMQIKGETEMKKLDEQKQREIEEAKAKLDGADKKKTKEVLSLIVAHYQSLENDVRAQIQLEHDVEQEKIKKEVSVNSRLSSKEAQGSLINELIAEAKINEEEAGMIVAEHLEAIAAVEKIHDDEKSRQVMALEMRLEERKAMAQEIREQQEQEAEVLATMKEKYDNALENLVISSQVTEAEATAYREKLFKDVDNLDKKLEKQKNRQEQNLHDRLTLLKKKKMEEKEEEYKLKMKKLEETNNDSESPKDVVVAKHELTQKYNEEMHELERELDKNAAQDLKELRDQQAEEARGEYKNRIEKYYKELMKKGGMDEDYNQLLESHDQDIARILENQQAQQNKQKLALQEKLNKRRELLTEKMKAEQKEQEQIRNEEQKVLKNMIDNQVVISEEEKEKILREHEQNMAELESSLTLNKLRQKQMLEEKLEKRRAMRLEKLAQKHENENKRIKIENVDGATEEVDLLKKQEIEKQQLLENDENMEKEIEQIREEMLNARMEALQEHNDRLGTLIADLQIKRANQIAEINKQQRALGQLQTSIIDDLDEKGVLVDPETKEILKQHQEQSQKLEAVLKNQRDEQEKALKERLREKLKQKEQRLIQEQKDEVAKYIDNIADNNALMRFRKAALKGRHKAHLEQERQQIEKEIEQSVNELKLQLELNRLKAVEKQSIQFISALVKCGKIQEDELDSVLQVLFPTKTPEEIDELLSQIYGPSHTKRNSLTSHSSKPSSLEMKVIAQISPMPSRERKAKPRFETPGDLESLPPPSVASNLPPVVLQGSKGFNLQSSLKKDNVNKTAVNKPLGKVRLAPLDKH